MRIGTISVKLVALLWVRPGQLPYSMSSGEI